MNTENIVVVEEAGRVSVFARPGHQQDFLEAAKAATGAGRVRTTTEGARVGLVMQHSVAKAAGITGAPKTTTRKKTTASKKTKAQASKQRTLTNGDD